jgi:azurin
MLPPWTQLKPSFKITIDKPSHVEYNSKPGIIYNNCKVFTMVFMHNGIVKNMHMEQDILTTFGHKHIDSQGYAQQGFGYAISNKGKAPDIDTYVYNCAFCQYKLSLFFFIKYSV